MKKLLPLLLTTILALALCACSGQTSVNHIIGSWQTTYYLEEEDAQDFLDYLSFDDDEIAYADLGSFAFINVITFNDDKTYSDCVDVDSTKAFFRNYLDETIISLYENKSNINYTEELLSSSSLDEFKQIYAELFDFATYDEFITYCVDSAFETFIDVSANATGTYKISESERTITFMSEDDEQGKYVNYSLNDDASTITLEYSNGATKYTKMQ